ncbi:MAG: hypothetical protein ACKV22_35740 [Bryobacteraceae bacterium]
MLLLLKLPDVSPARLLALGRKPMGKSHWHHLVRWAERSGVAIPDEMAQQQERWEAEFQDGLGGGGWGELGSRRAHWPPDKDLAEPPFDPAKAPAASLPQGYGAGTTSVTHDLEAIRQWIRERLPKAPSELRPGLTVEEITARVLWLPFVLPEEVYELYRWADGSAGPRPITIVPGYAFLPLEEAVELCQLNRELHWRNKRWMPLFDLNGEVTLYAASAATPAATAPVGVFEVETGGRRHAPSLAALLATTRQRYESGRYVERDGRIWDRKHLARLGLV